MTGSTIDLQLVSHTLSGFSAALPSIATIVTTITAIVAVIIAKQSSETVRQENNKNAFFSLLEKLDIPIDKEEGAEKFRDKFPPARDAAIDADFVNSKLNRKTATNCELVGWLSEELVDMPKSGHFERNSLFEALAHLHSLANRSQKILLRHLLNVKIGDEGARFLIFQALAERDRKMLKTFGKFPLAFENLHRMPVLQKRLVRRFAKRYASEILKRAELVRDAERKSQE
jgi:hypothetical protein